MCFFYFARLALVVGVCDSKPALENSSVCVALGGPDLSGATEHEAKGYRLKLRVQLTKFKVDAY